MSNLIHNTKLAYIHLKLAENHLLCIEQDLSKYQNNKFKDLKKAVDKCFKALEVELAKQGETESLEETIIQIHSLVEEVI